MYKVLTSAQNASVLRAALVRKSAFCADVRLIMLKDFKDLKLLLHQHCVTACAVVVVAASVFHKTALKVERHCRFIC